MRFITKLKIAYSFYNLFDIYIYIYIYIERERERERDDDDDDDDVNEVK